MWRRGRRRQDQTKKEEVPEEQKAAAGPTAQNKGLPAWAALLVLQFGFLLSRGGGAYKKVGKKTEITVNF
jgi:hypothetical protein